jgi:hypothetical protein
MPNELAQAYRAQRDAEMDVAERARAALHSVGWDALYDATQHSPLSILAGPVAGHDRYLPDFAIDVVQEGIATPLHVLVAADGSQVMPDSRHRYPLAAVQAASITMQSGHQVRVIFRWWSPDDSAMVEILMSGERGKKMASMVEGWRDLQELVLLSDTCAATKPDHEVLVALPDGPLHIYRPSDVSVRAPIYAAIRNLPAYLGGVVDRGEAKYVSGTLARATGDETLATVRDGDLFGHLLPGQRSVLFSIASPSNTRLARLAGWKVGFFYLNPGEGLLRVETTTDLTFSEVQQLARIIMDASAGLGYPYILQKAHEYAEISAGMRQHMTRMHTASLMAYALADDLMSHKEALKAL